MSIDAEYPSSEPPRDELYKQRAAEVAYESESNVIKDLGQEAVAGFEGLLAEKAQSLASDEAAYHIRHAEAAQAADWARSLRNPEIYGRDAKAPRNMVLRYVMSKTIDDDGIDALVEQYIHDPDLVQLPEHMQRDMNMLEQGKKSGIRGMLRDLRQKFHNRKSGPSSHEF